MKWLEETRATRRSLAEVGLMTVVREVFGNRLTMTYAEADDTLGPGWKGVVRALERAGQLRSIMGKTSFTLSVVAPGDRKRARLKRTQRLMRDLNKFEQKIREGTFEA